MRRGNQQTAVPRLLAMLCVLAVFIPSFFMQGAAQALFVPLSLAVGFAMVTSYLLSSTFVPVLSTWLLRHHHHLRADGRRGGARCSSEAATPTAGPWARVVRWRWLVVPAYLAGTLAVIVLVGRSLGLEIFPKVDAGRFQLRMRAPDGTRYEETEQLAIAALETIGKEVGRDKVEISIGYVGLIPSSYPINAIYQWTGGPGGGHPPRRHEGGGEGRHRTAQGAAAPGACGAMPGVRLSFEPADIVSEVMSFGSPTPVDVAVTGPNLADDRAFAEKLRSELAQIPSLRDLQYGQSLDYPTISIEVDRERAGLSGVTAAGRRPLGRRGHLLEPLRGPQLLARPQDRHRLPGAGRDPLPGHGLDREIETVPIQRPGLDRQILLRDVAQVRPGTMPGEYDRYNMKRSVSLTANIAGEDLGRVAGHVERAIARAGAPPKGATVDVRGQIRPMEEILRGLGDRPGDVDRRHPAAADGQLPVGQARPGRRLDHARGGRRRGADALADRDDGQPPVVHGVDHGHRRGGGQRDPAGHLRRAAPPRGGCRGGPGRRRGREGPAPADPDDQLRHDRRHGADGAGLERGGRADRPARPGGHRRPGRRDPRDPDRAARPSSRWSRAGPAGSRPRSTPTTRRARTTTKRKPRRASWLGRRPTASRRFSNLKVRRVTRRPPATTQEVKPSR